VAINRSNIKLQVTRGNKMKNGIGIKRGTATMSANDLKNMAKRLGYKVVKISNTKLGKKTSMKKNKD
tara:strand:- start:521 stop:721 length:201 start_codon:yes stop_codon:yes gene_type:complete